MTAQECSQLLLSKNNILIITHTNPDGDTLCSAAALCGALRRAGNGRIFSETPQSRRSICRTLKYFAPKSFKSKYIVSVDVATEKMFAEGFDGAIDLCIDHHPTNSHYAKRELVPDKAAAADRACGNKRDVRRHHAGGGRPVGYIAVTTDYKYASSRPQHKCRAIRN